MNGWRPSGRKLGSSKLDRKLVIWFGAGEISAISSCFNISRWMCWSPADDSCGRRLSPDIGEGVARDLEQLGQCSHQLGSLLPRLETWRKQGREREREREREKEWKRERRKKGNGVTINIAFIPSAALTGWHNESVSTTPGAVGFHLLMATLCPETLLKYSILRLFFWFILLLLWLFWLLFSMLMISDVESWKTFPCHLPINHDHYHH